MRETLRRRGDEKGEEEALNKPISGKENAAKEVPNYLPGCIGFYGKPVRPWFCDNCAFAELCKGGGGG